MSFLRWSLSLRGRWLLGFVTLLSAATLACFSFEVALRFEHKQGEQGEVHARLGMHLTDQYLNAAKQANQERVADYQAAGLDAPEPLFPVTWAEFEATDFDIPDLRGGEAQVVEQSDKGYTIAASRAYTESEGLGVDDNSLVLQVDRSDPALIRYTLQMEIQDLSEEFDTAELDALRTQGLGPKPAIQTDSGDVEIDVGAEDLGTELVTGVLEELLGAVPDIAGLDLDAWYAQKVMLETGMPTMSYSVELPGKINSHTLEGETVGTVELPGNRAVLVVDETFMRRTGPKAGTWTVTSVLHTCDEVCGKIEHMIWDGASPPDSCGCTCEDGWTPAADGKSCVQGSGRLPLYPARNIENTSQFEMLLRSRGYDEAHCPASGSAPPGSVFVWKIGSSVAHSSVMTAGGRQIEMGDKPGGKRYVSELLPPNTNPDRSGGKAYTLGAILCPPPGTIFDSAGAQKMDGIDRNYDEKDKWNCHGFSSNILARYATTGIRIEPGSKYRWEGNKLILESGRVFARDNHAFQIQLKGGILHPQSRYLVEVDEAGEAYLYVLDGNVTVDGDAGSTTVAGGQYMVIEPTGAQSGVGSFDATNITPWWEEMNEELFQESGPGLEQIIQSPSTWYWTGGVLCGVGLLALAAGGLFYARRRGQKRPAVFDPATVERSQRERAANPFAAAEQRFADLQAAYRAGRLREAGFQSEVAKLRVRDAAGHYWSIGGPGGRWYWYDGKQWVARERPRSN